MSVNINRKVQDAFYRYKMPELQAKVEGSGNGIKTVIPNMEDIAKSLERPPSYILKFFGHELGAQSHVETKSTPLRYIVNGRHEQAALCNVLDAFIRKFVLCSKCGNPETRMSFRRDQINLKCIACGGVTPVDMSHKVSTYMLKNPPAPKDKKSSKDKASSKDKKKSGDDQDRSSSSISEATPSPAPAVDNAADNDDGSDDVDDEDDGGFSAETLEKAKQVREEMNAPVAMLERLTTESPYDVAAGMAIKQETATAIREHANNNKLDEERFLAAISAKLWGTFDSMVKNPQFVAHSQLLSNLASSSANRASSEMGVLVGIEQFMSSHVDSMREMNTILKKLYDSDLLSEDVILEWNNRSDINDNGRAVRSHSAKMVEWLSTAEEEDD